MITHAAPPGAEVLHERVGDVVADPLLEGQPAGEAVHELAEPTEADQLVRGQVGHGRLAHPGHEVVRAHPVARDVPHDHELRVPLAEDGVAEDHRRIVRVARDHHLGPHPRDPLGGPAEVAMAQIQATRAQELAHGLGDGGFAVLGFAHGGSVHLWPRIGARRDLRPFLAPSEPQAAPPESVCRVSSSFPRASPLGPLISARRPPIPR
ncbi:hypothetical protein PPSIR1_41074, partial [Plesiocystis pacifica SIR-1]